MKSINKLLCGFLLLSMSLLSSSCLDIEEEYFIRKDGSGTMKMTMDLSEIMSMMEMMGGMEGLGADSLDLPSTEEMFSGGETLKAFEGLDGISNVQNFSDKEKKIISYSFDFASMEALNQAMTKRAMPGMGDSAAGLAPESGKNTYEFDKKTFRRTVEPLEGAGEDSEEMGMAASMMGESGYTVTYIFERKIKKVVAKDAEIVSQDGKSVVLKAKWMDLMEGKSSLNALVKLK